MSHLLRRGIDVKKVSDQTTSLALFGTYSYIRICVLPNILAISKFEDLDKLDPTLMPLTLFLQSNVRSQTTV